MENYTIGLDLGVSSVGWSIFNNDTGKVEKAGVRLFNQSAGAAKRREMRNLRRLLKRRKNRVNDMLMLFKNIGFPTKNIPDEKLIEKRVKGIKEKISKQDIVNILCYLAANRGYIPYNDDSDKVKIVDLQGKLPCEYYYELYKNNGKYRGLNLIVKNKDNIDEIKKLLKVQSKFHPQITNDFIDEAVKIISRKREFWEGPGGINQLTGEINQLTPYGRFKTIEDVEEYFENKRKNPEYEKYLYEELIRNCEICITEKVAPKFNYYAEYFNFINDFINISFNQIEDIDNQQYIKKSGDIYKLNKEGLEFIKKYILGSQNINVNIEKMFKETIGTNLENVIGMRSKDKNDKPKLSTFSNFLYINYQFEKGINTTLEWLKDIDLYNRVIYHLTVAPGGIEAVKMIKNDPKIKYSFTEDDFKLLEEIKNKKGTDLKYHSLSETVLKRAIEDMLKYEMNFMQVRKKLDYDKDAREYFIENYTNSEDKLFPEIQTKFVDDLIASPQVKKTLRQTIKIINAIINEKKSFPKYIAIESTKELNSKERKKKLIAEQKINEQLRKEAKQIIIDNFGEEKVTNKNIEKVMLYQETNGHCIYCNKPISLNDVIFEKIQVEHILNYSDSFDDSYDNKTLACINCNSNKGNKTPYYFLFPKGQFDSFKEKVEKLKISSKKKENLTFTGDISKYMAKFINRNLRDTAYATTELVKQINLYNYYLEKNYSGIRINTISISGQVTSKLRDKYGLEKDRNAGNLHHAVDASIIAAITNTEIGKMIIEMQNDSKFWKKYKVKAQNISKALLNVNLDKSITSIKNLKEDSINISWQVIKKPPGGLFNAKLYKIIEKENQTYKIEQIRNIYELINDNKDNKKLMDTLFNENDNSKTLLCYDNDRQLFNHLKDIYVKYKSEKGNPFVNYAREIYNLSEEEFDYNKYGIRVPSKRGNGPIIKRLRYYTKTSNPYFINKKNINMKKQNKIAYYSLAQFCTEVYADLENKKFIFLPIFLVSVDLKNNTLNRNDKYYKDNYQKYIGERKVKYLISLYNGDYIEVVKKNNEIIKGFYSSFDVHEDRVAFKNSKKYFREGDKQLTVYSVDILGNKYKRLTYSAY